jgi:hypothetical protein
VRQALVHDAVVTMEADGEVRAPGGTITLALCGRWEHEPPCPFAPHHIAAHRRGNHVCLRVLFATEPSAEADVRSRVEAALSRSSLMGPDGVTTRWQVRSAQPGLIRKDETRHAGRLIQT